MKNYIEELRWRGMLHDMIPGTEEFMLKHSVSGYAGFDPTSDSLHIGSLVPIMLLVHLQRCGHKPIALIGGATGMIGDPSGKSEERNLLSEEVIRHNENCVGIQLEKFLEFDKSPTSATIVNNLDWIGRLNFVEFIRDIGKHISVSYMLSKDSVKNRLENGLSFTEFTYQLVQGYDFYFLNENNGCKLQIGGSDQWGNITTGVELIRRKGNGESFAVTCPLLTKTDGSKFGKTESGNVWLDRHKTSPYKFYQYWLNCSDEDISKMVKIFSLKERNELNHLLEEHTKAPHERLLQKELAKELTIRVHSELDYQNSLNATTILFGKATADQLAVIDEDTLLSVFEGVPKFNISKTNLGQGVNIVDFLSVNTAVFSSKGEARRMLDGGGVMVNKAKVLDSNYAVSAKDLINNKYIIVQKGKKNYFLIEAE